MARRAQRGPLSLAFFAGQKLALVAAAALFPLRSFQRVTEKKTLDKKTDKQCAESRRRARRRESHLCHLPSPAGGVWLQSQANRRAFSVISHLAVICQTVVPPALIDGHP